MAIQSIMMAAYVAVSSMSQPADTTLGLFVCSSSVDMMTDVVTRKCTVQSDTSGGSGIGASLSMSRTSKGMWSRAIKPSQSFEHFSADKHGSYLPKNWQYSFPPMQCIFRIDQQKARDEFCFYESASKTLQSTYGFGGFRMNTWSGEVLRVRIVTHWTSEDLRFPMSGWEQAIAYLTAAKPSR